MSTRSGQGSSMLLARFLPRVQLAVIRALLDEVSRLHDGGDWQSAEAVTRQVTEALEVSSEAFTGRPVTGQPVDSAKLGRASHSSIGGVR